MFIKFWELILLIGAGTVLNLIIMIVKNIREKAKQEMIIQTANIQISEIKQTLVELKQCTTDNLTHMTDIWEKRYDNRVAYVDSTFVKLEKLNDILKPVEARLTAFESQHIGEKMAVLTTEVKNVSNIMLELVKTNQSLNQQLLEVLLDRDRKER